MTDSLGEPIHCKCPTDGCRCPHCHRDLTRWTQAGWAFHVHRCHRKAVQRMTSEWYSDHANIITLTSYLADHGYDAKDVAYAVEKPWKYGDEFAEAQRELAESTA